MVDMFPSAPRVPGGGAMARVEPRVPAVSGTQTYGAGAAGVERRMIDVGSSVANDVEQISPGATKAINAGGFRAIIGMAKANPKKAAALATVVALGSAAGYDALSDAADSNPVEATGAWLKAILAGVDKIKEESGLTGVYADEDGTVAGISVDDLTTNYELMQAGMAKLDAAMAADGGYSRFMAKYEFDVLDSDFKHALIAAKTREFNRA